MKRLIHLLPTHGEIALVAKVAIAEHLLADVAELHIQAERNLKASGDGLQHQAEHFVAVYIVGIDTLAIDSPLREQVGRNERATAPSNRQHVGRNGSIVALSHSHIRKVARRDGSNPE